MLTERVGMAVIEETVPKGEAKEVPAGQALEEPELMDEMENRNNFAGKHD